MKIGYNTNGFAHHRLEDAVAILAETGYQSIAITLDHYALNPFAADIARRTAEIRELLARYPLRSVIETGARFLLDSRTKHEPTLVSRAEGDRQRRMDFLRRAIDIAAALGSDAVSFWSGILPEGVPAAEAMRWLATGCAQLVEYAGLRSVRLAFEPEPGMLIARFAEFEHLNQIVAASCFGLTIDVGHVHCLSDGSIPDSLERWSRQLFNIHIEDMRRGVHEHLMFGDGEIEFAPVMRKLREIGYVGGVHVELSRHSHDAVNTARRAYEFLSGL